MEEAIATGKHPFLRSKCQVGSANLEGTDFLLEQKVFHARDAPQEAVKAKKAVVRSKSANILGLSPQKWNSSTVTHQRNQTDSPQLKRRLLRVRAGLEDEKPRSLSRALSDQELADRKRYVVALTGQGPIGKLSGHWMSATDERGLAKHCIRDDWADWNNSTSCCAKEDVKQAMATFNEKENMRLRMSRGSPKLNREAYLSPSKSQASLASRIREMKVDFQGLKDEFKTALRAEFPEASEERLQAMAQRLVNEKLRADEKAIRYPEPNVTNCKPNVSLTVQDRRFRVFRHPGTWQWSETEKRFCWSCCLNFTQESRGCESKVVNPDRWCTIGFER